jgi:hypothetical protein
MIDYSETLLSIKKSMDQVHKFLLAGDIDAAIGYLRAVSESADMLAAWIKNNK